MIVKSKIVLSADKTSLALYVWKKTFWIFGYWECHGSTAGFPQVWQHKIEKVTNEEIASVLYSNFIK